MLSRAFQGLLTLLIGAGLGGTARKCAGGADITGCWRAWVIGTVMIGVVPLFDLTVSCTCWPGLIWNPGGKATASWKTRPAASSRTSTLTLLSETTGSE